VIDKLNAFDIMVNVDGGGESGQAGAVRHGITRALIEYDAELKPVLKKAGLVDKTKRNSKRSKADSIRNIIKVHKNIKINKTV